MYCHNCGEKLEDGAAICPHCGASQKTYKKNSGSGKGKILLPLAAVVIVAVVVLLVRTVFFGSTALNPVDYVNWTVSGLDSEGVLTLSFDYDSLISDMGAKKDLTQREIEEVESLLSGAQKDFSISKSSGLSNGDEVTVESAFEKNTLSKYHVKFENSSITITVEGLTEISTFSVNDYVNIEFSGFEGYGYGYIYVDTESLYNDVAAQIRTADSSQAAENFITDELYSQLYVTVSPSYFNSLSEGDEIAAVLDIGEIDLDEYGIRFTAEEVQAEVSGLAPTETISLADYVEIYWDGFDGDGDAYASLDLESLTADLEMLFLADGRDSYGLYDADMSEEEGDTESSDGDGGAGEAGETTSIAGDAAELVFYSWRNFFECIWSQNTGLSNGDLVTLIFQTDEGSYYVNSVGVYLEGGEVQREAEGLTAVLTLDLTDYMDYVLEGYDGAGTVSVYFDEEKLAADLETFFAENARGAYGALSDGEELYVEEAVAAVKKYQGNNFSTAISQVEGISNGDILTISCDGEADPCYISNMGIYLTGGTKEVTAEGLLEPEELDLADAILVSVEGICPNLYLRAQLNSELPYANRLELDGPENGYVSAYNGDTFTWNILYDSEELLQMGYTVTNHTYTFEISGLDTYDFTFEDMECQAVSCLSETALTWATNVISDNADWLLEELNDGNTGWFRWDQYEVAVESARKLFSDGTSYYNQLYLICHATLPMVLLDGSSTEEDVYFVIMWKNIIESPDGSITLSSETYDYYAAVTTMEEAEAVISERSQTDGAVSTYELDAETQHTEPEDGESDASSGSETDEAETETADVNLEAEGTVATVNAEAPTLSEEAASQAVVVISYNGHTYARFDEVLSWEDAEKYCESLGGTLATVTSGTESSIIEQLLADSPYGRYWLGGTDEEAEGSWKWVTGEAFVYTDWDNNQPDNDDSVENYMVVGSKYSYHWNDLPGESDSVGFILELSYETEDDSTALVDLTCVNQQNVSTKGYVQDPYGGEHYGSLQFDAAATAGITYSLGGAYETLTASLSTWADADSNASFEILIIGDGETLYSLSGYTKTDRPIEIQIDLQGVDELRILAYDRNKTSYGYLFLNEAVLTPAADEAESQDLVDMPWDLTVIDSVNYSVYQYLWRDIYGDMHSSQVTFGANGGDVLWNLDGEYTSFSGTFTVSSQSLNEDNAISIAILLDGDTVYEMDQLDKFQGAQDFAIDLTGGNTLEIIVTVDDETRIGDIYAYLADAVFTCVRSESEPEGEEPVFPEIDESVEAMAAEILTYGNYRYYRFDIAVSWQEASQICEEAGGTLVSVTTAEKQAAVYYLVSNGSHDEYWLGGSYVNETWTWQNGESFDYSNWSSGQPDFANGLEYLMTIYKKNGTWNDRPEEYATGFIMEVKAESGLLEEADALLADLEWSGQSHAEVWSNASDSQGEVHLNTIVLDASNNSWLTCELDGQYASMSGNLSIYEGAKDGINVNIGIFGDGVLLYEARDITRNQAAEEFTVDLTGVKTLIVVTGNTGSYDYGYLLMSDVKLFLADEPTTEQIERLGNQVMVDSTGGLGGSSAGLFVDAYGVFHSSYISMNAADGSSILYNLSSGLTTLYGTLTVFSDTSRAMNATFSIYLDNASEPVASYDVSKDGGPVSVEVDITGASTIRITAETDDEVNNAWIVLTDDFLK